MRPLGTQKNGVSGFFHNCNRGKRSLAIDLKSSSGVKAVTELASQADVLVHNYRPGVMDKLGQVYPLRLVYSYEQERQLVMLIQ